jgi:hypothetical protein
LPLLFFGCGSGSDGAAAPTTGTISGSVTDAVKGDALAGVTVTASSDNAAVNVVGTATTDASGNYALTVPIGGAYVNFSKTYYTKPGGMFVGVGGGQTTSVNAAMSESAAGKPSVSFAAVAGDDFGYGATVALAASANDPNGDTLTYTWSNGTGGVPKIGTVTGTGTAGSLTFPTMADAFQPRLSPTDFMDISGYILEDKFGIVPIIPDTRGAITATVKVDDGRGQSTTVSLTLNATSVQTSDRNVPVGTRVYLNSGHANNNSWTLTAGTAVGSTAQLDNVSARTPFFIPDKEGSYILSETGSGETKTMTIFAGSFVGVIDPAGTQLGNPGNTIPVDVGCLGCHDDVTAPNKFASWAKTGHATIFKVGIDNGSGTSGSGCFDCHTVGNDRGAASGGFDDVASASGFVFPSTRAAGNWDNLLASKPAVARLANIQCENCHGPNTGGAHQSSSSSNFLSDRISFAAEVCGTCHGRTTHNIYSQWNTRGPTGRGHSNKLLSDDEGTNNRSCARCHGAQGFFLYQNKLKASTASTLTDNEILNITSDNIQPQTCTACHDPHDVTNPNQLRIYNNTPGTLNLPAGFRVAGWGKGALCVTCHNTRNGAQTGSSTATYLHEDTETYNDNNADGRGDPTGYSAPHTAAQGDVVAGRNAYFMGSSLPMISKHAAVEDVCVGCHMKLNAKTAISHGEHVTKTHLFRLVFTEDPANPETQIVNFCSNCHGTETVNGEAIIGATETGLANLAAKIGTAAKTKINGFPGGIVRVRAYNSATDLYSSTSSSNSNVAIDVAANPVVSVGLEEGHGQIEFHITLTTPISITWTDGSTTTTNQFGVQLGSLKDNQATPVAIYALTGNMVRAGWNYFLIEGDDSHGIHNPGFAQAVLNATMAQDLSN